MVRIGLRWSRHAHGRENTRLETRGSGNTRLATLVAWGSVRARTVLPVRAHGKSSYFGPHGRGRTGLDASGRVPGGGLEETVRGRGMLHAPALA